MKDTTALNVSASFLLLVLIGTSLVDPLSEIMRTGLFLAFILLVGFSSVVSAIEKKNAVN